MGGGWKGQDRVKCIIGVNASVTFVWIQWVSENHLSLARILFCFSFVFITFSNLIFGKQKVEHREMDRSRCGCGLILPKTVGKKL